MLNRPFAAAQAVIAVVVFAGFFACSEVGFGPLWVKLLISIPTLLLLAVVACCPSDEGPRYRWSIATAFVFSQIGAFLLEMQLFVPGVLVYLVANIAYLVAFTTDARLVRRFLPFLAFGLIGGSVLLMIWGKIPAAHRIPLFLYGMAIISVPAQATTRLLVVGRQVLIWAVIGTALLLFSDITIGIQRYCGRALWQGPFIMITYYIGQWCITMSMIRWTPSTAQPPNRRPS